MYRALTSFTTKDYDIKYKQILEDDFTTEDEITEFLNVGYIEVYDGSLEITENGIYDVKDYQTADVNVSSGGDEWYIDNAKYLFNENARINVINDLLKKCKNITSMEYMFNNSTNITSIDMSNVDTSNVERMSKSFYNCLKLTSLNVSNFNTSKCTYFNQMFYGCSKLTSLDISSFDLSKAETVDQMFGNCTELVTIDVSNINPRKGYQMFYGCSKLSNDSLNSILKMCATATNYVSTKTLAYLSLSQAQATTCTTLSNYQDFLNAGWTTGY